jgi:hypothetical protein
VSKMTNRISDATAMIRIICTRRRRTRASMATSALL